MYQHGRLQTNDQFVKEFSRTGEKFTKFVPHTYDAVWAIALTMRRTQELWIESGSVHSLDKFTYSASSMTTKMFNVMQNLSYRGISVSGVSVINSWHCMRNDSRDTSCCNTVRKKKLFILLFRDLFLFEVRIESVLLLSIRIKVCRENFYRIFEYSSE